MSNSRPYQPQPTSSPSPATRGGYKSNQRGGRGGRGKSLFDRTSYGFNGGSVFNNNNGGGNGGINKFKKHYNNGQNGQNGQNGRGGNKFYKKHFNGNNNFKKNSGNRSFNTTTTDTTGTELTELGEGRFENPVQEEEEEEEGGDELKSGTNELTSTGYFDFTVTTTSAAVPVVSAPLDSPLTEEHYQFHREAKKQNQAAKSTENPTDISGGDQVSFFHCLIFLC